MHRLSLLLLCMLALPLGVSAQPMTFQLDPVHTRLLFAVSHAGYSQALGTVSGSTGTVRFDPDDWSSASVSVSIPMKRFDLGDAGWNRAVGAPALLDVEAHPVATFVSNRIEPRDKQHAKVCGSLTFRGTARDVCLDVTFNQLKRMSLPPFRRTVGFSATTTISRKAFGMDAWQGVIGDDVGLRIEAEGELAREQATPSPQPATDAPSPPAPVTPRP
jgi:polyisoprenoid-binding protein YceI